MKAASRFQRPPSSYLGGVEWGHRDHLLTFAYELFVDNTCSQCGRSVFVCRNDDNLGLWEADTTICAAQAAVDERRNQEKYKPEPGEMMFARPIDEDLIAGSGLVFKSRKDAYPESDGG